MKTKKASYKAEGYSFRYAVRRIQKQNGLIRPETGKLCAIQLINVENGNRIMLSDDHNGAVYHKVLEAMAQHFDFSTQLKMELILSLNDLIFTFDVEGDEIGMYYPWDADISLFCNAKAGFTDDEWLRIMRLTTKDAAGALRDDSKDTLVKWDGRGINPQVNNAPI